MTSKMVFGFGTCIYLSKRPYNGFNPYLIGKHQVWQFNSFGVYYDP